MWQKLKSLRNHPLAIAIVGALVGGLFTIGAAFISLNEGSSSVDSPSSTPVPVIAELHEEPVTDVPVINAALNTDGILLLTNSGSPVSEIRIDGMPFVEFKAMYCNHAWQSQLTPYLVGPDIRYFAPNHQIDAGNRVGIDLNRWLFIDPQLEEAIERYNSSVGPMDETCVWLAPPYLIFRLTFFHGTSEPLMLSFFAHRTRNGDSSLGRITDDEYMCFMDVARRAGNTDTSINQRETIGALKKKWIDLELRNNDEESQWRKALECTSTIPQMDLR